MPDTPDVPIRATVVDYLKPLLPRAWKWFDYSTAVDEITKTTVILTLQRVVPLPDAPRAGRSVEYTLSVIDPSGNPSQREDSLDDSLVDLLNAIDDHDVLSWSTAERGLDKNQQHLGYDITISFPIFRIIPEQGD